MSRLASLVGYHWSWEIAEVRYTTRVITKPRLLTSLKNDGASWTWTRDYIWGPTALLATVSPKEGTKHYVNDHLGSPRLVCDRGAHTLAKHNYYPYGEESTYAYLDRERIKFTGHERDLGLNGQTTDDLDYMHARYYTFNLGRFMSVDPIGGSIGSSQSWNRYSYVHGNPINLIDPWGLSDNLPTFSASITVTATAIGDSGWSQDQAQMYILGMIYNDWLRSQRARSLSASVDGGIMARLAQQPVVRTVADVLLQMASLCTQTSDMLYQQYSNELFGGMQNEADLQLKNLGLNLSPALRSQVAKFGITAVLGNIVSNELGKPTPLSFIFNQLTGNGPVGVGRVIEAGSASEVGFSVYAAGKSFQLGLQTGVAIRVLATPCWK